MEPKTQMEYRRLGGTGLKVSAIGFGPQMYVFGAPIPPELEQLTHDTLKRAIELGVNYIDIAEYYGSGLLETYIGNSLRKLKVNREDVVVSTKIFFGPVGGANSVGCSRKRLIEGLKNSLKRLQFDYVDIAFAARYDDETSLEEVCRAMDHLVRTEKTLYWGTSEWSAVQITQANELCERLNLYKPVVEQTLYNMISRERVESEYADLFESYKLGVTVWSPLAAGLLTGKYLTRDNLGKFEDQYAKEVYNFNQFFGPEKIEKTKAMFKEFEEIAKSLGGTVTQLALAWVIRNKDVSSMICAFSRIEQVDENLKAMEMMRKFTPEIDERIEKLLGNKPKTQMDWKKHALKPSRR